jgi:FkbH-like protein
LNIGIDTLVFVDDQPFERAEVAASHPGVRVVDSVDLARFLDSPIFDVPVTAESQARRAMYRQEIERSVALQSSNGDYLAFLRGCGMRLAIAALSEDTVALVYELAQRTNQMNFSGSRYSLAAIETMLSDETIDTYVLRASDRFGDYGIIGFCVVEKHGPLMRDLMFSCRIQSKHVDRAFLAYLIQTYADIGQPRFEAIYNETAKNRPAAEVFWEFGFEKSASDDTHHRLVFDSIRLGRPVQDVVTIILEDKGR